MNLNKNIVLLGMMGSGKSTVGKILAKKMEMPFVDLDEAIEKSAEKSIKDIFEIDGENTFRRLEADHLRKVSGSVVSCGGGIILQDDNCNFIQTYRRNLDKPSSMDTFRIYIFPL